MPLTKSDKAQIAVNASTEPGAIFNTGNAVMNFTASLQAGLINIGTGILCLGIRCVSELRKKGIDLPLPGFLNKLVSNPGAAIATNGALLATAGLSSIPNIDLSHPTTAIPTAISVTLGAANISQGYARGLEQGSIKQRLYDAFGQIAGATGLVMASADAPLPVRLTFVFSGAVGAICAVTNQKAFGPVSPNLIAAGGCIASGCTNESPAMQIANAFWAAGYIALDALVTKGGVIERVKNLRKASAIHPEIS